jgi:PAS domain S-box-containing protein
MRPGNRGRHPADGVDAAEAEQLLDRFLLWTALVCATFGPFEIATASTLGVWQLRVVGVVAIGMAVVALVGRMALVRGRARAAITCACGGLLVGGSVVSVVMPEIDVIMPVAILVMLVALPLVQPKALSVLFGVVLGWALATAAIRGTRPPTPGIPEWFHDVLVVTVIGAATALALFLIRSFHWRLTELLRTTHAAETRYRTLVEQLPAVTFVDEVEDADPFAIRPLYVSPQVESLLGYPVERWLADSSLWRSILHPDDRHAAIELADRIWETREPYATEYRIVAADGRIVWIQEASVIIPGANGQPSLWQGVLFDVTARHTAEEERSRNVALLRRADRQRRELLAALVSAQEAERKRLATEIHDDPVQKMTAVGLRLGALLRTLEDPKDLRIVEQLQATVELSISRLRAMMFELRPPALDRGGLVAAVRDLVNEMDGSFPLCRIEDRLVGEPVEEIRTTAYRIAVEALVNVQRHARASGVEVLFAERDRGLFLRVRDDGIGVPLEALTDVRPGHLGLTSIRERAEAAGGWSRIEALASGGTIVEAWLPAADDEAARGAAVSNRTG